MSKSIIAAVTILWSLSLSAQNMPQAQPREQVRLLDEAVRLDKEQERNIEKLLTDSRHKTDDIYSRLQSLKMELGREIGPDFDEKAIRKKSKAVGELSGELTAETALLQARIQEALTDEQRQTLLQRAQQMP